MLTNVRKMVPTRVKPPLLRAVHHTKDTDLTWRYTFNLVRTARFRLDPPELNDGTKQVLDEFRRDGIAIVPMKDLLGSNELLDAMCTEVRKVEESRADEIERIRVASASAQEGRVAAGMVKSYVDTVVRSSRNYDTRLAHDDSSPFARFALHPFVTSIVNSYLGMYSHLRHYQVWHNYPTSGTLASQEWHRDPEDRAIVKVFVSLMDVGIEEGPFTYAKGTGYYGAFRAEKADLFERGRGTYSDRRSDEEMAAIVPPDRWVRAVGPAGTIAFADTSGYHKGGTRENERLLTMNMYTSNLGWLSLPPKWQGLQSNHADS